MELQKNLSIVFNIFFPFTDFLYLFQQEEYSLQRFWFWFPRFFFRRNIQKRDKLVYTQRARNTIILSVLLFVFFLALGNITEIFGVFYFIFCCIFIPVFVLMSNIILDPIYLYLKKKNIDKAKLYFEKVRGGVKVVAITGSYGKTTVKNFTEQLVKYSYRTQMIPGNINSTIGIANWILNNFKPGTELLILEVDSYKPNRIKESTLLVKPDFSIITNIGDQHLQRYKTRENLAKTLFELFEFSPNKSIKITNSEDLEFMNNLGFITKGIVRVDKISANSNLSDSNNTNLAFASKVADYLGVPKEYIETISNKLTLPDRRQAVKTVFGFDGIDDSYNISLNTATAGIKEASRLAKMSGKKLLVITAGIPELGPNEQEGNLKLGKILYDTADETFIIESIFSKDVSSGFTDKEKYKMFENFQKSIAFLKENYDVNNWFVLVQPELTDIYY